jgi:hypothetical protein
LKSADLDVILAFNILWGGNQVASIDQERRAFFRLNFTTPIRFKTCNINELQKNTPVDNSLEGSTRNISQSGILFQTEDRPPQLSSILWMDLDMRTLKICQEIESKALIFNNGVLGKVVRVEEDSDNDNAYDVGVCFLRKDQKDSREVQQILSTLEAQA